MYELWTVSSVDGEITPIFLEDRGDFDELYVKFKEKNNTIITDKEGNIKESHFKI